MAHPHDRGLFIPHATAAELAEREQLDYTQQLRTGRRMFFRWLGWSAIGALVGQWAFGFTSFFLPKRLGVFGGTIVGGVVGDYQVGDVKVFRDGKCYVVRVPEGFLALWWKCPHLGCTVPWLPNDPAEGGPPDAGDRAFATKGHFKCPCHQSTYNRYGQIVFGPAPRPMSQFPLRVENGKIVAETGPSRAIVRDVAKGSDATPA